MADNLNEFLVKVRAKRDADLMRATKILQRFAFNVFENIVVGGTVSPGTPIDLGHARASWNVTRNASAVALSAGTDAAGAFEAGAAVASEMQLGDQLNIENNAPYINRLEYGFVGIDSLGRNYGKREYGTGGYKSTYDGHSTQAPRGMVRLAVAGASELMADAIAAEPK